MRNWNNLSGSSDEERVLDYSEKRGNNEDASPGTTDGDEYTSLLPSHMDQEEDNNLLGILDDDDDDEDDVPMNGTSANGTQVGEMALWAQPESHFVVWSVATYQVLAQYHCQRSIDRHLQNGYGSVGVRCFATYAAGLRGSLSEQAPRNEYW